MFPDIKENFRFLSRRRAGGSTRKRMHNAAPPEGGSTRKQTHSAAPPKAAADTPA